MAEQSSYERFCSAIISPWNSSSSGIREKRVQILKSIRSVLKKHKLFLLTRFLSHSQMSSIPRKKNDLSALAYLCKKDYYLLYIPSETKLASESDRKSVV